MKCTTCGTKLDMRKKGQYVYASYQLQSKGFMNSVFGPKDYWVFCSSGCKLKADQDWMFGDFEKKHGKKKIDFKP
jgi:hypothetical protein